MDKPLIRLVRERLKLSLSDVERITGLNEYRVKLIDDGVVHPDNILIYEFATRLGVNLFSLQTMVQYDGDNFVKLLVISIFKKYLTFVNYLNR